MPRCGGQTRRRAADASGRRRPWPVPSAWASPHAAAQQPRSEEWRQQRSASPSWFAELNTAEADGALFIFIGEFLFVATIPPPLDPPNQAERAILHGRLASSAPPITCCDDRRFWCHFFLALVNSSLQTTDYWCALLAPYFILFFSIISRLMDN